jgi:hypothetical protein
MTVAESVSVLMIMLMMVVMAVMTVLMFVFLRCVVVFHHRVLSVLLGLPADITIAAPASDTIML